MLIVHDAFLSGGLKMSFCFRALVCAAFAIVSNFALAEPKKAVQSDATPQAKQEIKIETIQVIILIKSTIMALQHANQTGNYSVLRDLGSPVFRERFDQASLTAIFSDLRRRGFNLSLVMQLPPNLTRQPEITEGNELHLVGNFPTQPLQVQFDMLFLQLDGVWRLNGLSVDVVPVQAAAIASATPQTSAQQATPPASNTMLGIKPKNGAAP